MKECHLLSFLCAMCLCIVPTVHASVRITEIMYDPPAEQDRGYEWIEIVNTGTSAVSIADVYVYVDGVRHLLQSTGTAILPPKKTGVVVQNRDTFFSDYPAFLGNLFVSSFSLRQDTGSIRISTKGEYPDHYVTYISDTRADGTGGSLHITESDASIVAPATPGIIAVNPIVVDGIPAVLKQAPQQVFSPTPRHSSAKTMIANHTNQVSNSRTAAVNTLGYSGTALNSTASNHTFVLTWIATALTIIILELFALLLILCRRVWRTR